MNTHGPTRIQVRAEIHAQGHSQNQVESKPSQAHIQVQTHIIPDDHAQVNTNAQGQSQAQGQVKSRIMTEHPKSKEQPKPNPSQKSKPKHNPPPESYIPQRLTHINLNDKLEYNRSTIPFPDNKPATEDEINLYKDIKAKIGTLRTEYL